MDLVTPAYRAASTLACALPGPLVEGVAPSLGSLVARRDTARRRMVERHQRRVDPTLSGPALAARVRDVYRSYARYYGESFRLPSVGPEELDERLTYEGYEHVEAAREAGVGPMLVLPHLGSWEWCAYWLTRVAGVPVTAVVERLEPPALFEWFVRYRESIGMHVVPLGPHAAKELVTAIKQRHVIALLVDRDITGGGVEVSFFGEKTTLPSGPAALALRTGSPLLPTAVYDREGGHHHGVVRPPIPAERRGSFRDDVARITQAMAVELESLIRAAPEQWHLMQPNWPSDREALSGGRR
ncbi:MAG TPA: phosphatidylinositol mannoside acyltransferase [Acidimicrobiales bacterium]|nr:phosphatidylinositol mannoside acyltransferase [Acidimicrobiales bacterium]